MPKEFKRVFSLVPSNHKSRANLMSRLTIMNTRIYTIIKENTMVFRIVEIDPVAAS